MSLINRFLKLYNSLQKSDNGSKVNRFSAFLHKLFLNYSLPSDEVKCIGLMSLFKIVKIKKKDIINPDAIEALIWKTIRNNVIQYSIKEAKHKDRMICESSELDWRYGITESYYSEFELEYDTNRIVNQLKGRNWIVANLILLFGDNANLIRNLMGMSHTEYKLRMKELRVVYEKNGY